MPVTTVSSLPAELVLDIFEESGLGPLDWAAVSSVWRRFALRTPSMWTKIFLQDSQPDESLERCKLFAFRSGKQNVSLTRIGVFAPELSPLLECLDDKDKERQESSTLHLIDMFCEILFARCRSYSYTLVDRGSNGASHLSRLFVNAPNLRKFELSAHSLPPIVVSSAIQAKAATTPIFPNIVNLYLSCACITLFPIAGPALEEFHLQIACTSQHTKTVDGQHSINYTEMLPVFSQSSSLCSLTLCSDTDVKDPTTCDRIPLFSVLASTMHDARILFIPLVWPISAVLLATPRTFLHLHTLEFNGVVTQPRDANERVTIEPLILLMRITPDLESLTLCDWTIQPKEVDARHLVDVKRPLPRVSVVYVEDSLPIYTKLMQDCGFPVSNEREFID